MVELDIRRRHRKRTKSAPRRRRGYLTIFRRHRKHDTLNKMLFGGVSAGAFALAVTDTDRQYNLTHMGEYPLSYFTKDFWNNITLQRPVAITQGIWPALKGVFNQYTITGLGLTVLHKVASKFVHIKGFKYLGTLGKGLFVGGAIGGLFNLDPDTSTQKSSTQSPTSSQLQISRVPAVIGGLPPVHPPSFHGPPISRIQFYMLKNLYSRQEVV